MHPRLQNGLSAIIRLFWFVSEAVLKYTWGNYDISILKLQVLFAAEYALALLVLHCTHSLQCSLPVVYSKLDWHDFYVPISPWCMYCFCLGYLLHFLHFFTMPSLIRLHLLFGEQHWICCLLQLPPRAVCNDKIGWLSSGLLGVAVV